MHLLLKHLGKPQNSRTNTCALAETCLNSHHANLLELSGNDENKNPHSQSIQSRATAVQKSTVQTREDRPLASEADAVTRTFGQLYEGQQIGKSECLHKAK